MQALTHYTKLELHVRLLVNGDGQVAQFRKQQRHVIANPVTGVLVSSTSVLASGGKVNISVVMRYKYTLSLSQQVPQADWVQTAGKCPWLEGCEGIWHPLNLRPGCFEQ